MGNVGKSMVLRDLSGRMAGYVRGCEDGWMCRTQVDTPAQLGVVFEDGSQRVYALEGGRQEQRIDCQGCGMHGCYVFREEELLLISQERMRGMFEMHVLMRRKQTADEKKKEQKSEHKEIESVQKQSKGGLKRPFAQRRWPPPPCWDTARYEQGSWREP